MTSTSADSRIDLSGPFRARSRTGLVAVLVGAGILHFVIPSAYEKIVPRWIGHERTVVYSSGVAEILVGALLAAPKSRQLGAWCAMVLFVVVFPANVQMALDAGRPHDAFGWGVWARLPLQIPLIAWAYRHTH